MFDAVIAVAKLFNLSDSIVAALRWNVDRLTGRVNIKGRTADAMIKRGLIFRAGGLYYLTPWGSDARTQVRAASLMTDSPLVCDLSGTRTVEQIKLGSKLSDNMVAELLYGRRPTDSLRLGRNDVMLMTKTTEKALVARGLVDPVDSDLTDLGWLVVQELLEAGA